MLPSLISSIVLHHESISRQDIHYQVGQIYPFLKAELFMRFDSGSLVEVVDTLIDELNNQKLVCLKEDDIVILNPRRIRPLQLLAAGVRETLQRYAITLSLLNASPEISRNTLEKESRMLAQRLSVLHGINAPEFFDKAVFSILVETLREEGYIDNDENAIFTANAKKLYAVISRLMSPEIRLTIESVSQPEERATETEKSKEG